MLLAIFSGCDLIPTDDLKNESKWIQLGGAFDNIIYDVKSDTQGKIYVSGGDLQNISVWDGVSWNRLGNVSETFNGGVYPPITVDNAGNVYAVGRITVPNANSAYHVAKWDKLTNKWINLTSSKILFDNGITAFAADKSGNLYAAGNVLGINGITPGNYVYKWNGNTWSNLGGKLLSGYNIKLHTDNLNNIYASMGLNDKGSPFVARWSGSVWEELGGANSSDFGIGQLYCINSDSQGNIYGGGYFTNGMTANNIYKWTKATNTSSTFYTFESTSDVNSIAFDEADTLYVAGNFTNSKNLRYIAKYHPYRKQWSDYYNLNANNNINSICFDTDGNLYAGGEFTNKDNKYYVAVCRKKLKITID